MFQRLFGGLQEEVLNCETPDGALHAVMYSPQGRPATDTVIIVPPDGEERSFAVRPLVTTARALAAAGHNVIRFDFAGQGLSEGDYPKTTIASRIADLKRVWQLSQQRFKQPAVVLGVRFGATIAIAALADLPELNRLVLWEPVLDAPAYLQGLLRVSIATQMVAFGKVLRDRNDLIEAARGGELISINGFNLSGAFVDELLSLDPVAAAAAWSGTTLALCSGAVPAPWSALPGWQFTKVPPAAFWREPKVHNTRPPALLEPTLTWLRENQ